MVKKGSFLRAIDECAMCGSGRKTLTIGRYYMVVDVDYDLKTFLVYDDDGEIHEFDFYDYSQFFENNDAKYLANSIYDSMLNIDYKLNFDERGITYEQAKLCSYVCVEFLEEQQRKMLNLSPDFKCTWYKMVKEELDKL